MDKEIKQEIKRLTREGLGEQLAIITACANKGKPELASEYLEEMHEDIEPEPEDKKADEALDKLEAEHEHIMKNGRMYKVQKEQPEYNI